MDHSDSRRNLSVIFDHHLNSPSGFMEGRIIEVKEDCKLGGGHVHGHAELFFMISGEATFTLYDEQHPDIQQIIHLIKGHSIKIPARIAHSVETKKGAVMVTISEAPYEESSTHTRPAIGSQ